MKAKIITAEYAELVEAAENAKTILKAAEVSRGSRLDAAGALAQALAKVNGET